MVGSASTVSARRPGKSRAQRAARGAAAASCSAVSASVPVRASRPSGSAPRLPVARRPRRGRALGVEREQLLGGGGEISAGVQDDGGQVQVDAAEHVGQGGHRQAGPAERQPQRGDAVLQVGQHGLVGPARVRVGVLLPDVPAGDGRALHPAAAHERREPGRPGAGRVPCPRPCTAAGPTARPRPRWPAPARPPPRRGLGCPTWPARPRPGAATAPGSRPGTPRPTAKGFLGDRHSVSLGRPLRHDRTAVAALRVLGDDDAGFVGEDDCLDAVTDA